MIAGMGIGTCRYCTTTACCGECRVKWTTATSGGDYAVDTEVLKHVKRHESKLDRVQRSKGEGIEFVFAKIQRVVMQERMMSERKPNPSRWIRHKRIKRSSAK